uniref:F-BAR domain-containing protein n=1 Tax=Denticeps clupeoides TaxID=299321 RepID=A0AAY4EBE4_9TELE
MRELHFKDNFWNSDITSTGGYDSIVQHLNDGKRTCKEVEDFIKARAAIEERYAKDLLGLSKKVCGHNEMNTLKRSLDVFKLQTENVSLSHFQLAQTMREEAKKMEEFREKQKDARKKVEQQMDALHKHKSTQYKKSMEQSAEEAGNSFFFLKFSFTPKRFLSSAKYLFHLNADRLYSNNVSILGKIRDDWQKEHVKACELFEKLDIERINTLRNIVWTHLNHLSQQCVTSDELYEEVRKSLEQCNIQEDIEHFINLRRTGDKPPAPIPYENFYSNQRAPPPRQPPQLAR